MSRGIAPDSTKIRQGQGARVMLANIYIGVKSPFHMDPPLGMQHVTHLEATLPHKNHKFY